MNTGETFISSALHAELVQLHPYPLLFATISGSRAFGYASPDSDYDIHGVHQLLLSQVLELGTVEETVQRKATHPVDALGMDIATHDLRKFVQLLLKGNGNVLEDLYSPLVILSSSVHEELKLYGQGCITTHLALHYKNHAFNQQRRMKANAVKGLLHLFRCLLMGLHLMRSGELVMDVPTLADIYGQSHVHDLVSYKQEGFDFLPEGNEAMYLAQVDVLTIRLEQAQQESSLPVAPSDLTRTKLERMVINAQLGVLAGRMLDPTRTINEARVDAGLPDIGNDHIMTPVERTL